MLTWEEIQSGLETFFELMREDQRVQEEFQRSRGEFFLEARSALAPGAELRHLEWFLLERPSSVLGSIPVFAWQEEWRQRQSGAPMDLGASLPQSLPGAFEVTSILPSEGLWVRDLFTQGEHPVAEISATRAITTGDLLVGRLFPAGGGVFLLSPAVAVFRNSALLSAVRADLERMRSVRRGVLRIQQLELERLFQGSGAESSLLPRLSEVRTRTREELVALGLNEAAVLSVLQRVRASAETSDGREITEILNKLAFDTGIDLTAARLVLIELWDQERRSLAGADTPGPEGVAAGAAEEVPDAFAALSAFDRGRAEGKDLDHLFRELERALDVPEDEAAEEEEPDLGAPDFPGVVSAMVAEFLWEVERERGSAQADAWRALEQLGSYGRDIGVFEELGRTHLLDFSARWVLDESGMRRPEEVERLFEALQAFCLWCEEQQDLPLARTFGATLEELRLAVPRHLLLRQSSKAGLGTGAYRVAEVRPDSAVLSDRAGREQELPLSAVQVAHLREGDLVRLVNVDGVLTLGAGYPSALADQIFGSTP